MGKQKEDLIFQNLFAGIRNVKNTKYSTLLKYSKIQINLKESFLNGIV